MIEKITLKEAVFEPFKQSGFTRKGQSWYFRGKDTIVVANLQKSDWGPQYYINIGFWLKDFGEESFPPYNQCHLYYRVERIFRDHRDLINHSCSLIESDNILIGSLSEFIEKELIPFLRNCTELEYLKKLMKEGRLEGGLVREEARMYLSKQ